MYTDYRSIFLPFSLISSTSALYFFSHRLWIYLLNLCLSFSLSFFLTFVHVITGLFVCVGGGRLCGCVIVRVLSIFWIWICYQIYAFQIFSPIFWVVFFLIVSSLSSTKVLNSSWWSPVYLFHCWWSYFLCQHWTFLWLHSIPDSCTFFLFFWINFIF